MPVPTRLTALVACLTVTVAGFAADRVFTQKPTVAPSVDLAAPAEKAPPPNGLAGKLSTGPVPLWIWGATADKNYTLKKSFPGGFTAARLVASCDNKFSLTLNGQPVAGSDDWNAAVEVDVTKQLKPEGNTLVAEVVNEGGAAGFVLKLVAVDATGKTTHVTSDESWAATEKGKDNTVAARKVATYGEKPWGDVFAAAAQGGGKVPANTFQLLPGFQVELLFSVPKNELGSWVCLTADDKGRLIASDQDGKGLVRITPPPIGSDALTKVERLPVKITAAQGLLYANGALYVCCNGGPGSGIYRLRSTKGDDTFDEVVKLKSIDGGGEHGPHALRLAPDGKSILVVCGNHTKPPSPLTNSRVPANWGEDHLLPRQWDANGHARGIMAPGGYVARTDFDGKTWEIMTSGYRNPYDFAFNADGEMFVYDADMEWDMGMPWYRPTRVNHATSGSELGWRSGTGKWPAYYVDSLPALVDIGPGSPVGVEFGYGAKFPAKYQKALFICDWTFGTMYAIHIEPEGSTYKAVKEEFLSRTPLPLTDVVINPVDGAMYFTVGGRGAQSELYRVTYIGKESTARVDYHDSRNAAQRDLRHQLEQFHSLVADPEKAIAFILPQLGNPDRFIRYAARVALEHQPVKLWQDRVPTGTGVNETVAEVIALARQGDKTLQPKLLAALEQIVWSGLTPAQRLDLSRGVPPASLPFTWLDKLSEAEKLDLIRAYALVFIRTGAPDDATASKLAARLDPAFPDASDSVNRELVQLLVYLKSPTVLAKTLDLLKLPSKPMTQAGLEEVLNRNRGYGGSIASMLKNAPDLQKLHYAFVLRNVKTGWTMDHWKTYFGFLTEARGKNGGASYQGFINNIERDAFDNATDNDRLAIEAAGLRKPYKAKALPKAVGPGRDWTTADIVALEPKLKSGRNFKNGEKMFAASRCIVCHRFGGDGGATGPDLSQVAGRFGLKDLVESIVEPSKVISDQYKASVVMTQSGKTITGKVVSETKGRLVVVTDPEDSSKVVEVEAADVETVRPSAISLMPEKLLQPLNESEVLDLIAYMLSRGDPGNAMFRK